MTFRIAVDRYVPIVCITGAALILCACKASKQPAESPTLVTEAPEVEEAPAAGIPDTPPETLSDRSITQAIERQLLMDRAVDVDKVDVTTNQGIVELTGTAGSLLAKERATRIAELVKGVRAVSNQIAVVPATSRSEDAIRNDIKNALFYDPATEAYEIGVAVDDSVVTLTGTVQSWQERQLAERVAKGVKGVTELANEIEVDYQRERSDLEIENEIVQRLRWDALVDAGLIDVEVQDGAVTLSGTVGSAAERSRAYLDAWVAGVESVDPGDLEVKWWAREPDLRDDRFVVKSDEAIEQAIRDAARYDPRVSSFAIEPEVTAGIVTLRGTVNNIKARQAAGQLARNTLGVVDVRNEIEIRVPEPVPDEALSAQVNSALARNPMIEGQEIVAKVDRGTVTLSGSVDYFYEKVEAENVAQGVRGVVAVNNQLEVANKPNAFVFDPYLYPDYPPPPEDRGPYVPEAPAGADAEIRDDIQTELLWSPFVDADEVTVSVVDGRATLTGTVDSWRESRAATANAFEGGAIAVVNRLDVRQD